MVIELESIIDRFGIVHYHDFIKRIVALNDNGDIDDETALFARQNTIYFSSLLKSKKGKADSGTNILLHGQRKTRGKKRRHNTQ